MGQVVLAGPSANLSPIDLKVAFPEHLAGSEAVGSWGFAAEPFVQKRVHLGGPVWRMIAARNAWGPSGLLMLGAGLEVVPVDFIEARAGQTQLLEGGLDLEFTGAEESHHMTDQRSGTAAGQLEFFSFSSSEHNRTGGRCPPDPLGFIALQLETAGACRAGINPSPTCRLQASSRRSGCVPAEPYPPLESVKNTNPQLEDKG